MAVGNNGSRMIGNTEFYGGLSTDRKIGIENSYFDGECLDVRKSPSQMTVLPMARTLTDSANVTGLMTAMTQSKDGNIWGVDEKGRLYKIDENNAIIPITPSGKNLFSGYTKGVRINPTTGAAETNSTAASSDYIALDLSAGDKATFSGFPDNLYNFVAAYNSDKVFLGRTAAGPITERTLDRNAFPSGTPQGTGNVAYIRLSVYENSSVTGAIDDIDNAQIQLEWGNTATSYEPYVQPADRDDYSWSSGFGLENSDIDDGLWWADAGHKLFSYGKVLNPTGATQNVYNFEYLQDHSEYIDYAIQIQQNGDQIFYQSDPDIVRSAGTENITIKTSVSETEADKILFLPAVIPIAKIGIRFTAKGSGTVMLEIHDENNNVIASSNTKNASDVSTSGYTEFDVRPNPSADLSASNQFTTTPWAGDTIEGGSVLHIHIVASSSGYTAKSSVAGSLWLTADITSTGYVLHETFNKKHPMVMYDKLYIGNGRYVATKESTPLNYIDDTLFIQDALRLDDGFEVCSFGSSDEYLMIGAEKYSAGSTRGFQAGRIYFWDRQSEGPNFYIDCNMGSPKCIFNFGNIVYIIIAGALYAYTGGKELVKVRTLKGTDTEYSGRSSVTEVYPNMMTIRREILMIAFPSNTTAYSIRHGVYAFGSVDKNYPNCFTYNYKIPGATADDTLDQYNSDGQHFRIGCVYNFNDTLFYSYEVTTTIEGYTTTRVALAVVDNDSGTSTSYKWESLQYDAGSPAFQKMALRVGIYFDPLPENTTITPKYRIDDGEWVMGPATAIEGDRYITCEINQRFHELQYGLEGTTGNDLLTPVIKQVSAEIRVLNEEAKL